MAGRPITEELRLQIIGSYKTTGEFAATARALNCDRKTVRKVITAWRFEGEAPAAPPEPPAEFRSKLRLSLPRPAGHRRFILTSAQNNTRLHEGLWANLTAYAAHLDARLIVGRFIYRKDAMGQEGQEKAPDRKAEKKVEWDARLLPHCLDERLSLADDLVWCGEMNILPTAERPLTGLDNYTGIRSSVFPHPKVAMESVATSKHEPAKFLYTTGAVTEPNYIKRKAGLKAEFHHVIGALVVEIDEQGDWFTRQINAESDGTFYDLNARVSNGKITEGHSVEAINWGDIHVHHLEDWMKELCWGRDGIIDRLRPRYQFMHDTLDFQARSHHDVKDPHEMFEKYVKGKDNVEEELKQVVQFIRDTARGYCETVIVESNHDNAYLRWVKEASHKNDPPNALFLLRSQLRSYEAMERREEGFHLFGWALRELGLKEHAVFLDEDDSFIICKDSGDGIEQALHGHRGPNGSRGSASGFKRMGRRMTIGHGHAGYIMDGVYAAPVLGALDQGYNIGPSNWSQGLVVTYENAKRAQITIRNRKWRAA